MNFISTRGNDQSLQSAQAIIAGIADDGGLFVPEALPKIDGAFIEEMSPLSYEERACKVLGKFLTDYTEEEIAGCVKRAYGDGKFDTAKVAPVNCLDDKNAVLELWHGPTSAFKDMALQLLPQLMSTALKKTGESATIVILVATSGDTGKAALEGFKDVDQIKIIVFYPQNGVSNMQRLQMVSQTGGNVSVVAVDGNFDDAQTGVKKIFNDANINGELLEAGCKLSSANSINWGRLVPQIVYYFSAYADLLQAKKIKSGEKINFVVPTGNFGNILAGFYAKKMGLPVNKFICASNSNNVLTDFLRTGEYDKNREFFKTVSPSMDILISSNLERLLYFITDGNQAQVKAWMGELSAKGRYDIGAKYFAKVKEEFAAYWADDAKTEAKIRIVNEKYGYTPDTHTAVAFYAAEQYKKETGDDSLTVIVSTASPYKFNRSVLFALTGENDAEKDEFAVLQKLEKVSGMNVPKGLAELKNAAILHKGQCQKEEMPAVVKQFAIK
jgi:threonine synthase